jgi:hypothetical protein
LGDKPTIQYLNTDLALVATVPFDSLAAELKSRGVYPLYDISHCDDGQFHATLETEESYTEPDANIAAMLTAIEALPSTMRHLWDACTKREFNIGYDCGDEPWAFNQGLSNETLRRIAQCGCTLRITLYPNRPES